MNTEMEMSRISAIFFALVFANTANNLSLHYIVAHFYFSVIPKMYIE